MPQLAICPRQLLAATGLNNPEILIRHDGITLNLEWSTILVPYDSMTGLPTLIQPTPTDNL
jgi:hypothetical protein